MEQLKDARVQTSIHYPPVHLFSLYRKKFGYKNRNAPEDGGDEPESRDPSAPSENESGGRSMDRGENQDGHSRSSGSRGIEIDPKSVVTSRRT